ncbi:hypothetical protein BDN72DRAFT_865879 [Pluteus cervinus]|uniref:Uncharacterized protein n=1 Tax=Pluteus cervinus TaxID=181527 RepID=A0ACD2ZYR2_9AGAR|nr:hypothetical protein BDN72DRAFT_865879 [Pluteus cervinus]
MREGRGSHADAWICEREGGLDLGLDIVNGVRGFKLNPGVNAVKWICTPTYTQKGPIILERLAGEKEVLLVGWHSKEGLTLLWLEFWLRIINRVRGLDLQGDGLSGKGLHKDLRATAKTEDEMQGGLLLDVVVGQSPAILELLASEDKTLLVRTPLEGDGLAGEILAKICMIDECGECELQLSGQVEVWDMRGKRGLELGLTLLMTSVGLGLDVVDGVRGFDLNPGSDAFKLKRICMLTCRCEGFNLNPRRFEEDLHALTLERVDEGQHANAQTRDGSTRPGPWPGCNRHQGFDLKGDGLASQGLNENLHTTEEAKD